MIRTCAVPNARAAMPNQICQLIFSQRSLDWDFNNPQATARTRHAYEAIPSGIIHFIKFIFLRFCGLADKLNILGKLYHGKCSGKDF